MFLVVILLMLAHADPFQEVKRKRDKKREVHTPSYIFRCYDSHGKFSMDDTFLTSLMTLVIHMRLYLGALSILLDLVTIVLYKLKF